MSLAPLYPIQWPHTGPPEQYKTCPDLKSAPCVTSILPAASISALPARPAISWVLICLLAARPWSQTCRACTLSLSSPPQIGCLYCAPLPTEWKQREWLWYVQYVGGWWWQCFGQDPLKVCWISIPMGQGLALQFRSSLTQPPSIVDSPPGCPFLPVADCWRLTARDRKDLQLLFFPQWPLVLFLLESTSGSLWPIHRGPGRREGLPSIPPLMHRFAAAEIRRRRKPSFDLTKKRSTSVQFYETWLSKTVVLSLLVFKGATVSSILLHVKLKMTVVIL